jgi:hypothetical protein
MRTLLWSVLLSCALGASLASTATSVFHVDPSGSDVNGDGTWTNPYATISHAYDLACSNGGKAVVYALPGVYAEASTLVLDTTNVLVEGAGPEQSFLDADVFVPDDTVLAHLCINGAFSNIACAIVHNVKLMTGVWGRLGHRYLAWSIR